MGEPVRFTNISMEWDDDGAVVISSIQIFCPRCDADVAPGVEHRCGNKHPDYVAPKKKRRRALTEASHA